MTIGEKLRELIDWSGKSQADIARIAGVSQSMVSNYVRDIRVPSLPILEKLAKGLDVTVWAIINNDPLATTPIDLTTEERQIIGDYRMLSGMSRQHLKSTISTLKTLEDRRQSSADRIDAVAQRPCVFSVK